MEQESLGVLLVNLTKELSLIRGQYTEMEAKNRHLFSEMQALQHEKLELRTHAACEEQRLKEEIASLRELIQGHLDEGTQVKSVEPLPSPPKSAMEDEFWRKTVAEAAMQESMAKERAAVLETKLAELQALFTMGQDELVNLKSQESKARLAVVEYEKQMQKVIQENAMLKKEQMTTKELLRRCQLDLQSREETLNQNHKKMQQLQSHCEQLTAENVAIRTTNEQLQREIESLSKAKEEIAALKHSINALKGTVTAKTAEAKAFQAYGSSAREHLQTQGILLQQHAAFETRTLQVASAAMSSISGFRQLVDEAKDIFVNWKSEMLYMFSLLSKKLSLSTEYVQMAFAEHKLLRHALTSSADIQAHLHDQVWQVHRNALMVCQIINEAESAVQRRLTANYLTGELMYRPEKEEEEIFHLQFDHIFSNRAKEWSSGESILPTIQSVLHGYNACIITFQGQPDIERSVPDPAAPALSRLVGQNATTIVFEHLFEQCQGLYGFATTHCSLSYLGVYSEIVHDLLAVDAAPVSESIVSNNPTIVLDIRNAQEADIAIEEGLKNFEKICARCPTMEYLTHKIITICVTIAHNFDGTVTKSKLQLVELASGIDSTIETTWQDTERIRATISAENSLHAFTTCLSEIRLQDASFVRYHGSKLTLLLQDCINLHAKALIINTIRTNIDERGVRNLHMLQLIRDALYPSPEIANEELSLDMFLNRAPDVYRYQIRWQPAPRSTLQPIVTSWECELEAMKLRNKIILETSQDPKLSLESPAEATKSIKKPKRKIKAAPSKRMPFR